VLMLACLLAKALRIRRLIVYSKPRQTL
jgi:hypothetical protein